MILPAPPELPAVFTASTSKTSFPFSGAIYSITNKAALSPTIRCRKASNACLSRVLGDPTGGKAPVSPEKKARQKNTIPPAKTHFIPFLVYHNFKKENSH